MDFREKREKREAVVSFSQLSPQAIFFLNVPNAPRRNYHHHKERINFLEKQNFESSIVILFSFLVYFFMVAGMRASMGLPSAASFSISTKRATPSQTNWRSSTSE